MRIKDVLIDLHKHIDGSISVQTAKELSAMQNIDISNKNLIEELSISDECSDLNEYLSKFKFPLSLLQTKEAITHATYRLCEECKEEALLYAELRFAPQLHTQKGLTQREVVEAAIVGLNKSNFNANLILCCMRGDKNSKENIETVELAHEFLNKGVCAIDLAGAEGLYKIDTFDYLFKAINEKGLPFTVHCGEADDFHSVDFVLPYKPKRIGHGVRSVENEKTMEELRNSRIALELCPTSNLDTKIYRDIKDFPFKKLIDSGVIVTINTDNTSVSRTNIEEEYIKIIHNFSLDRKDVEQLVKNSINYSFANKKLKNELLKKVSIHKF